MNLYYHTSSKNFSIIFETESISPKSFYAKRSFGSTRFQSTPLDLSDEYLTLYSQPFKFDFGESENYPMWLVFDRSIFGNSLIDFKVFSSDIEPEKIYLFPKTIYFDHQSFQCLFKDPKNYKYTKIDSESYRNVKTVSKYKIDIISNEFLKEMRKPSHSQIMPNSLSEIEVEKDNRFNQFKGFFYGYAIGSLNEAKPEVRNLPFLISELLSTFTNAKSQIIMHKVNNEEFSEFRNVYKKDKKNKSRYDYTPPQYNINESKLEILEFISEIERIFVKTFNNERVEEPDLLLTKCQEILVELEREEFDTLLIEDFKLFMRNLSMRNKLFELLRITTHDFFRLANSKNGLNAEETELRERRFKYYLKKIENTIQANTLKVNSSSKGVNLDEIEFMSSYEIKLNKASYKLKNELEYSLFEIIIKSILLKPRPKKQGEISRDEKKEMIRNIGIDPLFQKLFGNKENPTDYYNDLVYLYNHYAKFGDLRIERIGSVILQNFTSFILKIDQFDELIEFCQSKDISNRKIAYGFWCAFNGFSDISEKNSKIIFGSNNWTLINSFENYFTNVLNMLENEIMDSTFNNSRETQNNSENNDEKFGENQEINLKEFGNFGEDAPIYGNESKTQGDTSNKENIVLIDAQLKKIESTIKKSKTFSSSHSSKKEDILEGFNNAKKLIIDYTMKGAEIFSHNKPILDIIQKQIREKNKKRRKPELKISELEMSDLLQSLYM